MRMRRPFHQCRRTCSRRAVSCIGAHPAWNRHIAEAHPQAPGAEAGASAWTEARALLGEDRGLPAVILHRCPRKTTLRDPSISHAQCLQAQPEHGRIHHRLRATDGLADQWSTRTRSSAWRRHRGPRRRAVSLPTTSRMPSDRYRALSSARSGHTRLRRVCRARA